MRALPAGGGAAQRLVQYQDRVGICLDTWIQLSVSKGAEAEVAALYVDGHQAGAAPQVCQQLVAQLRGLQYSKAVQGAAQEVSLPGDAGLLIAQAGTGES